ncbi:MAG TPA: hypothetical protein PLR99_00190 [Polyangiaceae bacterium]|nr:hypothetical protein [Polyangiaceae bacterium]
MKDTPSQPKSNYGRLVTSGNVRTALSMADACSSPELRRRHLTSARAQLDALKAECARLEAECQAFEASLALDDGEPEPRQASLFGEAAAT